MNTYKSFSEAREAAEQFFKYNFGYESGVGVESAKDKTVEFYSKDDPGMDDTFTCSIDSNKKYFCHNGGELRTIGF